MKRFLFLSILIILQFIVINTFACTYNYVTRSANNVSPGTAVTLVSRLSSNGTPTNPFNTDWACGAGTVNNTNTITVYPLVTTNYCCLYNGCWTYITVTVLSVPDIPQIPTGDSEICAQDTTDYYTHPANNALSYSWELIPASSGNVISVIDTTCSVEWNHEFSGPAKLIVKGVNGGQISDASDTLFIDVNYTKSNIVVESCDSYIAPDGAEYFSTGIVSAIIPNYVGCDSLLIIDLTIKDNSSNTITDTGINTYVLNGITYSESGVHIQTLTNSIGCDSILTLNLTLSYTMNGITKNGRITNSSTSLVNEVGKSGTTPRLNQFGQKIKFIDLLTESVSNIASGSVDCGGIVNSDGGSVITSKGVCWSTSSNPTIIDDKTTDGSGSATYASNITNLSPNTTYYVRAYATNSSGTFYGDEKMFTTLALSLCDSYGGGTVFYVDGTGEHGLICANSDQAGIQWYNGTFYITGVTATAIGTGQANTTAIIASQGNGSYAASMCDNLVLNGYDDWFLPSKDELEALAGCVTLDNSTFYWSSSESGPAYGEYYAWIYSPLDNISYEVTQSWRQLFKHYPFPVRAIRAF